jgi:hypothetical protein
MEAMQHNNLEVAVLLIRFGAKLSVEELAVARQRTEIRHALQRQYATKIAKLILLIWRFRRGNLRAMRVEKITKRMRFWLLSDGKKVLPRDMIRMVAQYVVKVKAKKEEVFF